MSNVMVLPGTDYQVALMRRLQELGHVVVCVNPDTSAPGFMAADIGVKGDILDKELCLRAAREHDIAAILSDQCDIAMPTVAYVGEALGLRTLSREQARLYTDKSMMREFAQRHGCPYPAYKVCRTEEEALDFFASAGVKCIIKPLDSNSSRGVFSVNCADDVRRHFAASLAFSKIENAVIVEEYIDGEEFTVDGLFLRSTHRSLAVSRKKHYAHNENIARQLYYSYEDPEYDYSELRAINDRFVELSGLKMGMTHAEYKFSNGRFYLIEIGARGGGNYISSHIVPFLTGIDSYKILISEALGDDCAAESLAYTDKSRCCVLKFLNITQRGTVRSIENLGALSDDPAVIKYELNIAPGDCAAPAENDSKRAGFYIAGAESRDALDAVMDRIDAALRIVVE